MSGTQPIRAAVIGYGGAFNMGKNHANQMIQVGMEFVAACDLDPTRMEQAQRDFPGIRTYTNVDELLADEQVDLVTVITPHNTHVPLATKVLESGKHCILEKPMCLTADEGNDLVQLANAKQRMLSVYHNRRWDEWYVTLHELINKGIIGDIFHVEMFFGGFNKPRSWWRSDKHISGGVFYDWGAHYIDWLLGFMPAKIRSVTGFIHNRLWHDVTNEDQMDSVIHFEDNAVAHVQISTIARHRKDSVRILGTKGAVVNKGDHLLLQTEVNGVQVESKVPYVKTDHIKYYENIRDHIQNGDELIVKPTQARRTIAVIETTEKAAKEGKALRVPFE